MRRNDNPVVVGQMATGDLGHFYVGVDRRCRTVVEDNPLSIFCE
jgi:hypothetical protein